MILTMLELLLLALVLIIHSSLNLLVFNMNKLKFLFILFLSAMVSACGGGSGDTKALRQVVEQNKLNIVSLVLNSNLTQTLNPVNTVGTTPTYYLPHAVNNEQITVTGINESGEEIALTNIDFSLIDNTATAGSTTIDANGNLSLETLVDDTIKQITVQADFATVSATANIVISSKHVSTGGLSLLINDTNVNNSQQPVTVCDSIALTATAIFDDGSTRGITRKISWPATISDANAKFDITDTNTPLFSAHTNALYNLVTTYDGQTENVDLNVTQTGFSNIVVSPVSQTLQIDGTQVLTLTADINGQQKSGLQTNAKWSTADAAIVDVDSATGVVTGKALGGPITITAACGDDSTTSSITVDKGELVSVEIRDSAKNPSDAIIFNITAGQPETTQLSLFAHYSDNSVVDISSDTANITWEILVLSGVISVNTSGLVTASSAGTATVTAAYMGLSDTIVISVTEN